MCGRYSRWSPVDFLAEEFDHLRLPAIPFPENWNIAPTSVQPVLRVCKDRVPEVAPMKWGLIPYWSKSAKTGYSSFNARCETLTESAAFRDAARQRRALVPADLFFEWEKLDAKNKQPHAIGRADGKPFCFAGLWDRWTSPEGLTVETFSIVTTAANELMAPLHSRMPVILAPEHYRAWLEGNFDLLRPFPAAEMASWRVGAAVGNTKNEGPELIRPLLTLFSTI